MKNGKANKMVQIVESSEYEGDRKQKLKLCLGRRQLC
jgi:hypothetical protein